MISNNILEQIGNTPIVRVQSLSDEFDCNVFMKMESFNPGGSHKARIALNMIEDAESKGILIPGSGQTLIEGTGGNTGLGLLMAANLKGYKVILVIPDNYSPRKMKLLRMFGAKVIQSDSSLGNNSHGDLTQEIQSQNPDFVWLNQQRNSANPGAHKSNTSQEIFSQIGANSVDFMVAGIGSGGHISGVGEELKSRFPEAKVVAIEPEGCSLLEDKHVFHQIQGLSVGLIPETLNTQVIDK
ncbi:PLP-dependent cysteine synthase family protein [Photobacterium proteolyticum]|uniref:PLP-dependent cysteine synthase family protein n=1 Tax=Photobacterium proteolyticum TaxID=1903952 RepID=UPI000A978F90|nr:pyridoxal-phosphate dependent enzyme [Photobacterium proteolyticum]